MTDTRSIDDSAHASLGHPSRHNDVAKTVSATPEPAIGRYSNTEQGAPESVFGTG